MVRLCGGGYLGDNSTVWEFLDYPFRCEGPLSTVNANVHVEEAFLEPKECIGLMIEVPFVVWDLYVVES